MVIIITPCGKVDPDGHRQCQFLFTLATHHDTVTTEMSGLGLGLELET